MNNNGDTKFAIKPIKPMRALQKTKTMGNQFKRQITSKFSQNSLAVS